MVPSPPEVNSVFGYLNGYLWAVHIWCCPTSVTIIESSGILSATKEMILAGCIGSSYEGNGYLFLKQLIRCIQLVLGFSSM